MKMNKRAAACALLTALAAAAMALQPVSAAAAEPAELAAYASEVVTLVNEERAIYGLAPVKASDALTQAAQIRAEETVQQFSHTRPDGRASSTVLGDLSIEWRSCGENIAYGYKDAEAVMDGWMHSDGHRANILSQSFEYIGVGVAERGGVIYCTQVFTGGVDPGDAAAPDTEITVPDVTITVPEVPAQSCSGTSCDAAPCIGDACQPEICPDGNCNTAPQSICIGGNCFSLPASTCPASSLLGGLLTGGGNCNAADILSRLTGNC